MLTFGHFDLVKAFSDLFWASGILLGTEHFTFKNTSDLFHIYWRLLPWLFCYDLYRIMHLLIENVQNILIDSKCVLRQTLKPINNVGSSDKLSNVTDKNMQVIGLDKIEC